MVDQQKKFIPAMDDDQTENTACRLLSLPAELRCWIWQLSFTAARSDGAMTDLSMATDPRKALLATCRQINAEAMEYYIAAAAGTDWWSTTKFCIPATTKDTLRKSIITRNPFREPNIENQFIFRGDIEALGPPDDGKLKLITRLRVCGPECSVEFVNGMWTCDCRQSDDAQPPRHHGGHRISRCPLRAIYHNFPVMSI
ncbi:hypothetical protein LTR37_016612 [Vermiconidia calcicola]|uniref:Uncharacterized protein n=1 Tax=Vermiconidia calcicola TaxID=1690605 RepID=A0ACC3MMK0_9PEZI|nr:hypothetical protein LTR37_016612 [Vermiconidia calcicola]